MRMSYSATSLSRLANVSRIGLRIGGDRANAELLGEFKNPLVGCMVLGKSIDALSRDFQSAAAASWRAVAICSSVAVAGRWLLAENST